MKRVLAISALLLGALAIPASASTACVHAHIQVNDQVVDQTQCV